MGSISPFGRLFGELKRRRVFRVAGVYAGTAFVVWQASNFLLPALGFPAWSVDLVVVLTLLGFPIALVLAWAFEVTPEGVRRTGEGSEPDAADPLGARSGFARLAAVFAAGALLSVAGYAIYSGWGASTDSGSAVGTGSGSGTPVRSVAVLPFADISPDGSQAWFGDGVAEEIRDALARLPAFDVKARTSSFQFRGESPDVRLVGDSLGVGAVLEGSVRRYEDRVRITVQLARTSDASQLWTETYERELSDVFEIQEEIAREVASALRVELRGSAGERTAGDGTRDPVAYQVYLKGREALREQDDREAMQVFGLAVEFDSTYAMAWAGKAEAALKMALRNAPTTAEVLDEVRRVSRRAVRRALRLDSTLSEAHAARARLLDFEHRWDEAERAWNRALALNPSDAGARGGYSMHLAARGRWAEALEQARRELELDPLHPETVKRYADMLMYNGRYAEAEERLRHVLDMPSEFYQVKSQTQLATLDVLRERPEFARQVADSALRRWSDEAVQWRLWTRLRLAAVDGISGREAAARRGLAATKDTVPFHAYEHMVSAVHAALGEADSAFHWLDASNPETWPPRRIVQVRGQPWWGPVRDDPRYAELLRRLGVER